MARFSLYGATVGRTQNVPAAQLIFVEIIQFANFDVFF
jgi:hypothetical protein